jgi:predicted metal-dependent HD superfamily phosphohydrolase
MALRQIFTALTQKYTADARLGEMLWEEIEKHYTDKKRHYHTLTHLQELFHQLSEVQEQIQDWDTLLFSLFYHDIIYQATSSDNEEKSAALAKERLQSLSLPPEKIAKCVSQILATKGHEKSHESDTNFFTDADLSVLGQSWQAYADYCNRIRKEYSIFPDFVYKPGRKRVLNHFLQMDRIFKTSHFFSKHEHQARRNLAKESQAL